MMWRLFFYDDDDDDDDVGRKNPSSRTTITPPRLQFKCGISLLLFSLAVKSTMRLGFDTTGMHVGPVLENGILHTAVRPS